MKNFIVLLTLSMFLSACEEEKNLTEGSIIGLYHKDRYEISNRTLLDENGVKIPKEEKQSFPEEAIITITEKVSCADNSSALCDKEQILRISPLIFSTLELGQRYKVTATDELIVVRPNTR